MAAIDKCILEATNIDDQSYLAFVNNTDTIAHQISGKAADFIEQVEDHLKIIAGKYEEKAALRSTLYKHHGNY